MIFVDRLADLSGSLKLRITVGFIASLVLAVGVITLVLVDRAKRDTLRDETRRELGASVRTARELSRSMVEMQRALYLSARQLDAERVGSAPALMRFMKDKPLLRSMFSNVFVAGLDGKLIVVADDKGLSRPDYSVADRDYFKRTLAEGRAMISEPVVRQVTLDPVIVLTQPVRNAKGAVVAVLSGSLLLSSRDLLANLVDVQDTDEQALMVVTDANGRVRRIEPLEQKAGARGLGKPKPASLAALARRTDLPAHDAAVLRAAKKLPYGGRLTLDTTQAVRALARHCPPPCSCPA